MARAIVGIRPVPSLVQNVGIVRSQEGAGMVCDACGSATEDAASFCGSCGRDLAEDSDDRWQRRLAAADAGEAPAYRPREATDNGCSIAGFVCGGLAFVFAPLVLGVIGIVVSGIAIARNERLAAAAMVVSFLGLVVGIVLRAILVTGFTLS